MTRNEMYKLIEDKYKATNWNDRNSIAEYNRYAREVRNEYYESASDQADSNASCKAKG